MLFQCLFPESTFQIPFRISANANENSVSAEAVTDSSTHCQFAYLLLAFLPSFFILKQTSSVKIADHHMVCYLHISHFCKQKATEKKPLQWKQKPFWTDRAFKSHPPFLYQLHEYHWWIILKCEFLLKLHTWKGYENDCVVACQFVNKPRL